MNWIIAVYSIGMATTLSLGIVAMKKENTYLVELVMSIAAFTAFFSLLYIFIQSAVK